MPLVVITGIPSSGKTMQTLKLKNFFEENHKKKVHVVTENEVARNKDIFQDSLKEKEIRGILKSQTQRLIGRDDVVILDAGNYIKGYRYELYCISKGCKTTQCTIHCDVSPEVAWDWNMSRSVEDQYSKEVFDALVLRYEPPDSRNRWDAPLFTAVKDIEMSYNDVYAALFERKPPPPNQSTQCQPLSSTNFLYELDRITQDVVTAILDASKLGIEGEVKVPECAEPVVIEGSVTPAQLTRLRRQFLSYTKMHPVNEAKKIAPLFVQFINSSMR